MPARARMVQSRPRVNSLDPYCLDHPRKRRPHLFEIRRRRDKNEVAQRAIPARKRHDPIVLAFSVIGGGIVALHATASAVAGSSMGLWIYYKTGVVVPNFRYQSIKPRGDVRRPLRLI